MKAIVRAASFALVLAAGSAAAQPAAPRPDQIFREIDADTFAAILRAMGMTEVTARDQREASPLVDFKARGGLEVNSRLFNCQRGNHPTRCQAITFTACWTRQQLGRDVPDAAAINTFNAPRPAGWAVVDTRGSEPRVCMRHAHVVSQGASAANISQAVAAFAGFVDVFRRQFPAQGAQTAPAQPGPAATQPAPAPAAPAQPAPATPAQPAPAQPAPQPQ